MNKRYLYICNDEYDYYRYVIYDSALLFHLYV